MAELGYFGVALAFGYLCYCLGVWRTWRKLERNNAVNRL